MERITVNLGERSYPISIGAGLFANPALLSLSAKQKVVIVTNHTVAPLYAPAIISLLDHIGCQHALLELPDGEQYKTLETFNTVMSFLLEHNYSRDVVVIALGGGVIGDLVGFAAACYQRGVDFIQIPTTLLSQVDSSVGGKTAVNHPLGKNMIGAFYQPKAVVIDTDCLTTLPAREFAAGMAEVIKYGIIYDSAFFDWLEARWRPCTHWTNKRSLTQLRAAAKSKPRWSRKMRKSRAFVRYSILVTPSAMQLKHTWAMAIGCTVKPYLRVQ